MYHDDCTDDEFAAREQIQSQSRSYSLLRQIDREHAMLFDVVAYAVGRGKNLREMCEDYSLDLSLSQPTKLDLLQHVYQLILADRRERFPRPVQAPTETLPVADIPLGLSDP